MKRSLFIILINLIALGGVTYAQTATPTLPYCATPNPATATPVPSYEDEILSYNPIAYWPLSETAGSIAVDAAGNGYHGTYSGPSLHGTTFINGDPAPTFDGVNDRVTVVSLSPAWNGDQFSIIGWVKRADWSATAGTQSALMLRGASNDSVRLQIDKFNNANQALFAVVPGSGSLYPTPAASGSDWVFMAITRSVASTNVSVYINGAYAGGSSSFSTAWAGTISEVYLGAYKTSNYWNGALAHWAVFNTVLSAGDISNLYSVPSGTPPTPTATPSCQVYNPTATPTADVYNFWTLEPGAGLEGQAVAFEYRVDAGSFINALLLFVIALLLMAAIVLKRMGLL